MKKWCMLLLLGLSLFTPCSALDSQTTEKLVRMNQQNIMGEFYLNGYQRTGRLAWLNGMSTEEFVNRLATSSPEVCENVFSLLIDAAEKRDREQAEDAIREVMAYFVDAAYDAYMVNLNKVAETINKEVFSQKDKELITRDLAVRFYKSNGRVSMNQVDDQGNPIPTPMGGTYMECTDGKRRVLLEISCDAFSDQSLKRSLRIPKIAHEVLGHGILRRYHAKCLVKPEHYKGAETEFTNTTLDADAKVLEEGIALSVEAGTFYSLLDDSQKVSASTDPRILMALANNQISVPMLYFSENYHKRDGSAIYEQGLKASRRSFPIKGTWAKQHPKTKGQLLVDPFGGVCWYPWMIEWAFESYKQGN